MGYRSQVALKTTTEGYLLLKKFNDAIIPKEHRPLYPMTVQVSPAGFYKIFHDDIKWYEDYPEVRNFMEVLQMFDEHDIPYKFLRIGEDYEDIEVRENYCTGDIPDEIASFNVERSIYDESEGEYDLVKDM